MIEAQEKRTITERFNDTRLVNAALNKAAREAVERHALAGREIPVWENGKVVWKTVQVQ